MKLQNALSDIKYNRLKRPPVGGLLNWNIMKMLIFVEKYGILSKNQFLRRYFMRSGMTIFGVVVVILAFAMIMTCPAAKENFWKEHSKEHRKSLILVFTSLVGLLVMVAYLMSHVGL